MALMHALKRTSSGTTSTRPHPPRAGPCHIFILPVVTLGAGVVVLKVVPLPVLQFPRRKPVPAPFAKVKRPLARRALVPELTTWSCVQAGKEALAAIIYAMPAGIAVVDALLMAISRHAQQWRTSGIMYGATSTASGQGEELSAATVASQIRHSPQSCQGRLKRGQRGVFRQLHRALFHPEAHCLEHLTRPRNNQFANA